MTWTAIGVARTGRATIAPMIEFSVPDMSCEHCAQTIQQAVIAVDARAQVNVDLGRKRVVVASTVADERQLLEAVALAGFSPARV